MIIRIIITAVCRLFEIFVLPAKYLGQPDAVEGKTISTNALTPSSSSYRPMSNAIRFSGYGRENVNAALNL